jgi:hypothetical protein
VIRPVTDTKALGALHTGFLSLASGEVGRRANRELAGIYHGYVRKQFDDGRSPYGERWETPLDGGRPGWRTGNLAKSAKVRAAGNRILLSASGASYAGYFVRSGRDIFPTSADGLPPKWKAAAERVYHTHIRKHLRGR